MEENRGLKITYSYEDNNIIPFEKFKDLINTYKRYVLEKASDSPNLAKSYKNFISDCETARDIILAVLGDELQPTTSRFVCVRCGLRMELSLDQNGLV